MADNKIILQVLKDFDEPVRDRYKQSQTNKRPVAESKGIDPLHVQYRQQRRDLITAIVQQGMHGEALGACPKIDCPTAEQRFWPYFPLNFVK